MFQHDYQISISYTILERITEQFLLKLYLTSHLIGDVFFVYSRAFLSRKCLLCQ